MEKAIAQLGGELAQSRQIRDAGDPAAGHFCQRILDPFGWAIERGCAVALKR